MGLIAHACPVLYRVDDWLLFHVMAGLVPAIHGFTGSAKVVDGRHDPRDKPEDMGRP